MFLCIKIVIQEVLKAMTAANEIFKLDVVLASVGLPRTRVTHTINASQPFLAALSLMASEVKNNMILQIFLQAIAYSY